MSDPAVDAARRAIGNLSPDEFTDEVGDTALRAAREALRPVRDLHRLFDRGHEVVCHDCRDGRGNFVFWPCDTAKLVYTSEELA